MTKVRIRKIASRTRWQLVTFGGKQGGEATGVLDLLAVRKDFQTPSAGLKRGDMLQLVLIQVKGTGRQGVRPAMPTAADARRLRAVAKRIEARQILLARWQKGSAVTFFQLRPSAATTSQWAEVDDLDSIFR